MAMTDDELSADLEGWLAGDVLDAPTEELVEPANQDEANRLLRALRYVKRESERITARAAAEIEQIAEWRDDRVAGLDKRGAQINRLLEGWTRQVVSAKAKRKSMALPEGTVGLRSALWRLEIVNDDALVEWCSTNARLDLLKLTGSKSKVKEATHAGQAPVEWKVEGESGWEAVVTIGDAEVRELVVIPGVAWVKADQDNFYATPRA